MLSRLEARLAERVPDSVEPLVSTVRVRQFVTTGTVGVAVDLLVLAALVETALLGPLVGGVAAKEAAVVVMFALNERWTFADSGRPGPRALGRRFLLSNVARALGNGVALAVYTALFVWAGVWYFVAYLAGIAVGFVFNYLLEGLWTWRTHRSH